MAAKKADSIDIFSIIAEKNKPLLTFKDLSIEIYHPNVIPKKGSLMIHNSQRRVSDLTAELQSLITEADELLLVPLKDKTAEQQERENTIHQRRFELVEEIDQETVFYLAALSKLEPETVRAMLVEAIEAKKLDIEVEKLVAELFRQVNLKLAEYNEPTVLMKKVDITPEILFNRLKSDLAKLRHYYGLNRRDALELPTWEFHSLIEEIERIDASRSRSLLFAVAAGFSGGDSADQYQENLNRILTAGLISDEIEFTSLEDIFGDALGLISTGQ